jgi:hypothetical protein
MDAVDETTRAGLVAAGALQTKYAQVVDRESAHEIITARLHGAAEAVAAEGASAGTPLPPPPPGAPPAQPAPKPTVKPKAKPSGSAKVSTKTKPAAREGIGEDVKDIGVGVAKDMLTTADGRRTLRTVFGALFGKK